VSELGSGSSSSPCMSLLALGATGRACQKEREGEIKRKGKGWARASGLWKLKSHAQHALLGPCPTQQH
jgi:hypothetical protein